MLTSYQSQSSLYLTINHYYNTMLTEDQVLSIKLWNENILEAKHSKWSD